MKRRHFHERTKYFVPFVNFVNSVPDVVPGDLCHPISGGAV